MNREQLDFNGADRPTKNDFTASTFSYMAKTDGLSNVRFYEFSSAATLVPYGSEEAYVSAPIDVIIVADEFIYYAELKGRKLQSDTDFLIEKGSFINPGIKMRNIDLIPNGEIDFPYDFPIEGYYKEWTNDKGETTYYKRYKIQRGIPAWVEGYIDPVFRIWWDVYKVLNGGIKYTKADIKDITIDPDSEKKRQKRGLLPTSSATIIDRIRSKDNDQ